MLRAQMSYSHGGDAHPGFNPVPNVPLLTNDQMVHTYCSPLPLQQLAIHLASSLSDHVLLFCFLDNFQLQYVFPF